MFESCALPSSKQGARYGASWHSLFRQQQVIPLAKQLCLILQPTRSSGQRVSAGEAGSVRSLFCVSREDILSGASCYIP